MSDSNVNPSSHVTGEINIKRLGSQQKEILRFLYRENDRRFQQVEIIEEIHGEVTNSRKASVSRSVNTLIEHGLIDERQVVWIPEYEYWSSHRVNYAITELGESFLENDDRFPDLPPPDRATSCELSQEVDDDAADDDDDGSPDEQPRGNDQ